MSRFSLLDIIWNRLIYIYDSYTWKLVSTVATIYGQWFVLMQLTLIAWLYGWTDRMTDEPFCGNARMHLKTSWFPFWLTLNYDCNPDSNPLNRRIHFCTHRTDEKMVPVSAFGCINQHQIREQSLRALRYCKCCLFVNHVFYRSLTYSRSSFVWTCNMIIEKKYWCIIWPLHHFDIYVIDCITFLS